MTGAAPASAAALSTAGDKTGNRLWQCTTSAPISRTFLRTWETAVRDHTAPAAVPTSPNPVTLSGDACHTSTWCPPSASSLASSSTTLFSPEASTERYREWRIRTRIRLFGQKLAGRLILEPRSRDQKG